MKKNGKNEMSFYGRFCLFLSLSQGEKRFIFFSGFGVLFPCRCERPQAQLELQLASDDDETPPLDRGY